MAIRTSFLAVSSIFRFASFAKNLKGEDDEEFFVPVSALRSAKGSWFCTNQLILTSFLSTRQKYFLKNNTN